jgi:hypothetical protein
MKFKKVNGKFYVNGEEFPTFEKAWAEIKKVLESEKDND